MHTGGGGEEGGTWGTPLYEFEKLDHKNTTKHENMFKYFVCFCLLLILFTWLYFQKEFDKNQ